MFDGSPPLHTVWYEPAWNEEAVAASLECYAEALLRNIATATIKPRQKLPVDELRDKLLTWHQNPPQVDRRLRELSSQARTLLAIMHIGKRCQWRVGTLLEIASCLGEKTAEQPALDGLKLVEELFNQGLMVPLADKNRSKMTGFADWLGQGMFQQYRVWVAPEILIRAASEWDALPELISTKLETNAAPRESDGLDWLLRLSVTWQTMRDTPAKLTQQGAFFKRDHDRLSEDPLINQPAHDFPTELPQMGHLVAALGIHLGLLHYQDPQVLSGAFPVSWQHGWKPAITQMIGVLSELHSWSPTEGWCGLQAGTNPWPSCTVVMLALLTRMEPAQWTTVATLAEWLTKHHCFWSGLEHPPELIQPVERLLLGVLLPMRIIQAQPVAEGSTAVRLTALGRSLLAEKGDITLPEFPKTLLVQPNMELMAYRQGLQPRLVAELSQVATWKTLGAACMLVIDQHSVHRGLEAGASFESLSKLFEQHCVHPPPNNVMEALRTWAAKRDRLAVYQGVNLLEFLTKTDLDDAISRGLKGLALADRYLLVENEEDIEYRHFRTLGTRDYTLPPTQCVGVSEDGVTLTVDPTRADLLLETELLRFTVPMVVHESRLYRMTYQTLDHARTQGLSLRFLGDWFEQRTGQAISQAAKLLWSDRPVAQVQLESLLILRVNDETQADGLWQWPETRILLHERLGPRVFHVLADRVTALRNKLSEIGLQLVGEQPLEIKASA